MTETTIDYGQLNDGAQFLYDSALEVGRQRGMHEGASRVSEDRLRANVHLAIALLESSVSARDKFTDRTVSHTRPGDDWPERVLAMHARTLLARTPSTPDVSLVNGLLHRANLNNAPGGIKRDMVDQALKRLTAYLEALGGYR